MSLSISPQPERSDGRPDQPDQPSQPTSEGEDRSKTLMGRAVRGGAILMAARLLVQVFVWSVTLVVAHLLTPYDYGILATVAIFVGLSDLLAEAGLARALVQKESLTQADINGAFTISLILAALLYVPIYFVAEPAGLFWNMPELPLVLKLLGALVLLVPVRCIAAALLDRELRLGQQAAVNVSCSVVQSGVVLLLAWLGFAYWALTLGVIVGRLLEAAALLRAANWLPRIVRPTYEQFRLIQFGLHVSLSDLLTFAYTKTDVAVIARFCGASATGAYSLAFQLISLPVQKLTINTNQAVYPLLCRLQNDPIRRRDWYLRLTVLLGVFGMPALIGMALVAPDALPLLLGSKWVEAVLPFQLLSVVGVLMVYSASLPPLFTALGRPDINLRYTAVCSVLFPLGFLLGSWRNGVVGVCIVWLTLYPLLFAAQLSLTQRLTGIRLIDFVYAQRIVVTAAVLMTAGVLAIRHLLDAQSLWLRLPTAIIGGAVIYAGVLLSLGRQSVLKDLRAIWRTLRNKAGSADGNATLTEPRVSGQQMAIAP